MVLSDVCIRRPVLASVLSLVVALIGLVSYSRLAVREYPNIDPPVVSVTTRYSGASPEIVETQVTQVLEESLAGIEGVKIMTSSSRQENSLITVTFRLARAPDAAAADVRDRVSRVRNRLPAAVDEPLIQKVEADAQPVLYLAFYSDRHSALEITDHADRYVKDQLQTLPGVAEVRLFGERFFAMRIWLDPERMAAFGITPQDVETALKRQNIEVPSGRIESVTREFTVLSQTDLQTPEEFESLVLRRERGYLVRLKDVGRAELGALEERRVARYKGNPTIALGVVKQATANPLEVSAAVDREMPRVLAGLPEGMKVEIAYDKSLFIAASIRNVQWTVVEAVGLVVAIIFLFLRSLRATLIPLVTIPVSLLGAAAMMYALGFSINTLTLLAMVLAIGLVVDDAIVMLENIHRHIEDGLKPLEAGFKGAKEIGFAVVAMTLTLAAVYIPIGLMEGATGRLFTEFAWALAGAVLVSGFVALTLSPMMCARMLRHEPRENAFSAAVGGILARLDAAYRRSLGYALARRRLVLAVGAAAAIAGGGFYKMLRSELAPFEDQGGFVAIVVAPEGATIGYTASYTRRMEEIFKAIPEVNRYFVVAGTPTVSQGIGFVRFVPWERRKRSQQEIAQAAAPALFAIPGVLAFPVNPPPLGQSVRSKPVEFVVLTSRPYDELAEMMAALMTRARAFPGVVNIENDLKLNTPQIRIEVDRDKAADIGVEVEGLGRTLETLLGGRQVTRFKREGKQYDVMVQIADIDRRNPDDLARIHVRARSGDMVPLSGLVRFEERVAPQSLNHFNQLRAARLTATLTPGYTLGDALAFLDAAADEILPKTARVDYDGQSREFKESSAGMALTFALALAFIYLVLAAQFESFVDPLIIMLTVPFSMAGALLALWLTGGTLNIYSQVGLVTLIGLITKHGILIVEFANQIREQGREVADAVAEAAALRLRPILMTTGAMVLGAVPLALSQGAGAESRRMIGWVIVGGLLVGTLFTLYIVPTVYTLVKGAAGRRRRQGASAQPGE
ncbi:MAG: efflux RND transporter permease subunit [Alphaproteobacteria bacterium]|nr:efflux RND transporter permease subunit [Alphaproteobacteria bacterium]